MPEYEIIDTTLREGEQTPGVLFSLPEKQRILDGLVQVGVAEVELGIASRFHPCVGPLIAYCRRTHPAPETLPVEQMPGRRYRLGRRSAAGPPLPVDSGFRYSSGKKAGKDRDWALRTMCEAIASARRQGLGRRHRF